MTTDAKLVGGDSHANSVEQTAQNSDLTANPAEQAVETEPQAATSAESAATEQNTDESKPLPDMSLPDIRLGEKIENIPPHVLVNLPPLIRWQVQTEERTEQLLGAIIRLFAAHRKDDREKGLEHDIDRSLAYRALEFALEELIINAAYTTLGKRVQSPTSSDYLFETPALALTDLDPENSTHLTEDPNQYTDVKVLQSWVAQLQGLAKLQNKIQESDAKIIATQEGLINSLSADVDSNKARLESLESRIEKLTAKQQPQPVRAYVPKADQFIKFMLSIDDGAESEVELVRDALVESAEEYHRQFLQELVVDNTEDAFFILETYKRIQAIIGRLAVDTAIIASNNYSRYLCTVNEESYLQQENKNLKNTIERKNEFIKTFSVFTRPSDEAEIDSESETPNAEPSSES